MHDQAGRKQMTNDMQPRALVFSDLDGTLLDHESYSFDAARPMLERLDMLGVPVIPVTSKTRAELLPLRVELGNRHPFITENGAAVFIPCGYFDDCPGGAVQRGEYWVYEVSSRRSHYVELLGQVRAEFEGEFQHFAQLGPDGIAGLTGLDLASAALANDRDYSEPVKWLGSAERKAAFIARLAELGAIATQGGRFLSVAGAADKGAALLWLRSAYQHALGLAHLPDIAAGDSPNDRAMLEQAETALVVRSPHHDYPSLVRSEAATIYSQAYGPEGWAEGLAQWLDTMDLPDKRKHSHG
ncbi:MAG: HAD-IIB family hydrolase [Pseudomonadota bacterium]